MREDNKMIEFLGTITAVIILAYSMRGAYFIVQDAQKRWEERNK
jgi:uncharacterized protein (UPF0333 family)